MLRDYRKDKCELEEFTASHRFSRLLVVMQIGPRPGMRRCSLGFFAGTLHARMTSPGGRRSDTRSSAPAPPARPHRLRHIQQAPHAQSLACQRVPSPQLARRHSKAVRDRNDGVPATDPVTHMLRQRCRRRNGNDERFSRMDGIAGLQLVHRRQIGHFHMEGLRDGSQRVLLGCEMVAPGLAVFLGNACDALLK